MQIPKLDKIVVNCGCGEARENSKVLEAVVGDLTPHPVAPEGDLGADGHLLTELEVGHRLLGETNG